MERACDAALDTRPRCSAAASTALSVVNVMTRTGPAPATELADGSASRTAARARSTTVGREHPPVVGQPSRHRHRRRGADGDGDRRRRGHPIVPRPTGAGPAPGLGRRRAARRPSGGRRSPRRRTGRERPSACWLRCTSTRCSKAWWPRGPGRRRSRTPAGTWASCSPRSPRWPPTIPIAWFPRASARAEEIATPSRRQPHRVRAIHQADDRLPRLGSGGGTRRLLAGRGPPGRSRRSGRLRLVRRRGHRRPVSRPPVPTSGVHRPSPRRAEPLFDAATAGLGRGSRGRDRRHRRSSTSIRASHRRSSWPSMPSAWQPDDRRGLTVTGGLPYFGGPGQQLHHPRHRHAHRPAAAIRSGRRAPRSAWPPGSGGSSPSTRSGVYGSEPPPGGFHHGGHLGCPGRHRRLSASRSPSRSTGPTGRHGRGRHRGPGPRRHRRPGHRSSPRCPTAARWPLAPADDDA